MPPSIRWRQVPSAYSPAQATAALGKAPPERFIADLRSGLDELGRRMPGPKLAVIGFCFGGGLTWQLLAAGEPGIAAAVPFYGPAPDQPDFAGSKQAAVLGFYGELDARADATRPAAQLALQRAGMIHDLIVEPGAGCRTGSARTWTNRVDRHDTPRDGEGKALRQDPCSMASSLTDVLASLRLECVNANFFVGTQLSAPDNHILGGHLGAQALMAASHTAPGRSPHSVHTYFLRPGDASRPVDFEVVELQEGRSFSARRTTARQDGTVLLEAMSSFRAASTVASDVEYQPAMPVAPAADELPYVTPHFAESAEVSEGKWASLRWFERRIVEAGTAPPARSLIWWRPDGAVPDDPMLHACLVAYLSAVTLTEPAFAVRPAFGSSAQRDHSVWFHGPADLSDWLLYDQSSPSSADHLALAAGQMFNRDGALVCTVKQEMYFPPARG